MGDGTPARQAVTDHFAIQRGSAHARRSVGSSCPIGVAQVDWEAEGKKSWCARMWRAKWNLIPRGPKCLPEIIRLTWYLQVISIVVGLHAGIDQTLFGPFFYARTSCCGQSGTPQELPAKYDVHYPDTLIYCALPPPVRALNQVNPASRARPAPRAIERQHTHC